MRLLLKFTASFCLLFLLVSSNHCQDLEDFQNDFIDEQQDILDCNGGVIPIPPDPPPPPFQENLLPIVIVNDSGLPDSEVNVLITGDSEALSEELFVQKEVSADQVFVQNLVAGPPVFVQFDAMGIGSLVTAVIGDNGSNYTVTLDQLPVASGGHVLYVPNIKSALVWFSMETALDMPVVAGGIQQPDGANPLDPNYLTNFDIFEFNYISTPVQVAADATAVTSFSIPLYGYLSTPDVGSSSNSGLFLPRSTIFNSIINLFSQAPQAAEWNKLILQNGSDILRVAAPEKSMVAGGFDINYLDNSAAYGYSYIEDIWSGITSFYRTNPLVITVPDGSLETYTGVINPDNTITFTSSPSGYEVVLAAPTTIPIDTTSRDIFGGLFFINSDTSPGAADGIQINKTLEEAIMVGAVPTADPITLPGLVANQSQYYQINPNLSPIGQMTGPWYNLYSKALHDNGLIYTFAFDEALWPQVLMQSTFFIPNQTYIGITIGNVQ